MAGRPADREGWHASRFETLDALRGVCALAIAFLHMPLMHPLRNAACFGNIQFCVDIFFVLSGFVLLHGYGDRLGSPAEAGRFMQARFWRLWPLHAATLVLLIAIEGVRLAYLLRHPWSAVATPPFGAGHRPVEIVTNLLFLQDFLTFGEFSWNFPSWSIAVEFYASAALAVTVLLAGPRARWVFAGFAVAAGLALHAASPDTLFAIQDWGLLRCLFDLFLGCLAYTMRDAVRVPAEAATAAETVALLAVLAVVLFVPAGGWGYAAPLLFAGVIALLSHGRGRISTAARGSLPQSLGRWSFSIYLLHLPVIQIFTTGLHFAAQRTGLPVSESRGWLLDLGGPAPNLAAAVGLVGVTVALAALSHRVVERPILAWRGRSDLRRAQPRPVSSPVASPSAVANPANPVFRSA